MVGALRDRRPEERRTEDVSIGQVRQLGNVAGRSLPPAISGRLHKAARNNVAAHVRRQKLLPPKIGIVANDDRFELDISLRNRHVLGAAAAQLQIDRPLVAAFAIQAGNLEAVGRDQRAGGAALQAARRGEAETEGKITG